MSFRASPPFPAPTAPTPFFLAIATLFNRVISSTQHSGQFEMMIFHPPNNFFFLNLT